MLTNDPLPHETYPAYTPGLFATPSSRPKLRDAAIIDRWLIGDDGTVEICIDAQCDVDFDRQKIIKVIDVDNILFRDPKGTCSDIRHSLSPDAKRFWIGRAQEYADYLGQWELDNIRDKVRKVVALVGNQT